MDAHRARRRVEFATYEPRPSRARSEDPADIFVRALREEDLDGHASLVSARQRISSESARAWTHREWDRFRRDPDRHLVLVALDGASVIAYGRAHHFAPASDAPANTAPAGWHLAGLVVQPSHRRRGVGSALVRARLDWIEEREPIAWYSASEDNRATIDLHAAFGFREVTRDFQLPGVRFSDGATGILFRSSAPWQPGDRV